MNKEDFNKIAPKLNSIKKQNSFKVPDGYFDQLPMVIQEQISQNSSDLPVMEKLIRFIFKPQLGWGSLSMAILVAVGLFLLPTEQNVNPTSDDIAEVIYQDEIENIDEEILIEALDEIETESHSVQSLTNEENNKEAIIEYLIENDIDETEVVNEFLSST